MRKYLFSFYSKTNTKTGGDVRWNPFIVVQGMNRDIAIKVHRETYT